MNRMLPRLLIVIGLVSLAALPSYAKDPKSGESDEQVLTQIENEWAAALAKADLTVIDRITASEWMLSDPEGNLITKAAANADLKSGAIVLSSFKIDDLKVKVHGDTAVVFGLETEKSSYKGTDTSGQYRFTDVFVKRHGAWKAIATHVTRVAKH